MAHITTSVEYGLHCLLALAGAGERALSARDLAQLQGISPSFVAKIFPKLEKAGLVQAAEGARGGYRLAMPAADITLLAVVDALEGAKPLFDCQEIRDRNAVFKGDPPAWAGSGMCAIHAAMLRAEQAMRASLGRETLAGIAATVAAKVPATFLAAIDTWIDDRKAPRGGSRPTTAPSTDGKPPE